MKKNVFGCQKGSTCILSPVPGTCYGPATQNICTKWKIPPGRIRLMLDIHKTIQALQPEINETTGTEVIEKSKKIIFSELRNLHKRGFFNQETIDDFEVIFGRWRAFNKGMASEIRDKITIRRGRDDALNVLLFLLQRDIECQNKQYRVEMRDFLQEQAVVVVGPDDNLDEDALRKRLTRQGRKQKNQGEIEKVYRAYWELSYIGSIKGTWDGFNRDNWNELARYGLPTWESLQKDSEPVFESWLSHPIANYRWSVSEPVFESWWII